MPLRLALVSLAALLAAACTAPTPPAAEPPLPYPPSARARMLRIALAEWEDWGRIELPAGARPPSTGAESDPANFPRVLAYWRALADDEGAVARNRPLYAAALAGAPGGAELWQEPYWSAAFVSYVLRGAGVDAREFPPAASHATYVDALIADALRFPATAPFLPHGPAEYGPRPDSVAAIGGNVLDAVTRTRFPVDASGYLLPPPPGAPLPFAVFENRLGRLPPWSPAS